MKHHLPEEWTCWIPAFFSSMKGPLWSVYLMSERNMLKALLQIANGNVRFVAYQLVGYATVMLITSLVTLLSHLMIIAILCTWADLDWYCGTLHICKNNLDLTAWPCTIHTAVCHHSSKPLQIHVKYSTSNWSMTTVLHRLSSSLFTSPLIILCYVLWVTYSVVKSSTLK